MISKIYFNKGQRIDKEVPQKYGYLSGYQAKTIAEQMRILREFFPNLGDPDEEITRQERPADSEGYFCIPRWQLIAPTYNEAAKKVFEALYEQRNGFVEVLVLQK